MSNNKIPLEINIYQNKNMESKAYCKWYGRVVRRTTLNTRGLCEHIQGHGSIYTSDVVAGVIAAMRRCIPELIAQGVAVQLEGLGTFYPMLESAGADKPELYNVAEHVKGVHVRFLPDSSTLDDITSRTMKEKCALRIRSLVGYEEDNGKKVKVETSFNDYVTALKADHSNSNSNSNGGETPPHNG